MIHLSDPLFYLLILAVALPWGLVAYLGMKLDEYRERAHNAEKNAKFWRDRARAELAKREELERQIATADPRVIPFRSVDLSGGKHRREVVHIPNRPGREL